MTFTASLIATKDSSGCTACIVIIYILVSGCGVRKCFAPPLSEIAGTKYSIWQLLGAAICLAGLALVLLSDAGLAAGGGGSNPLLGDFLVIAASLLFAISNVGEEFCVKKKESIIEVLAMIGVFGMFVSAPEIIVLEWKKLQSIKWSGSLLSVYAGFAVSSFFVLRTCSLCSQDKWVGPHSSILTSDMWAEKKKKKTSDMWAVALRIFFYKQKRGESQEHDHH